MEIAMVTEGIGPDRLPLQPWFYLQERLKSDGIQIRAFQATDPVVFERPFGTMMVYASQDWRNRQLFNPCRIMPLMEKRAIRGSGFVSDSRL